MKTELEKAHELLETRRVDKLKEQLSVWRICLGASLGALASLLIKPGNMSLLKFMLSASLAVFFVTFLLRKIFKLIKDI